MAEDQKLISHQFKATAEFDAELKRVSNLLRKSNRSLLAAHAALTLEDGLFKDTAYLKRLKDKAEGQQLVPRRKNLPTDPKELDIYLARKLQRKMDRKLNAIERQERKDMKESSL